MCCKVCNKQILDIYAESHRRRDRRKNRMQGYRHRLNLEEIRAMASEVTDPATFNQDVPQPLFRRLLSKIQAVLGF